MKICSVMKSKRGLAQVQVLDNGHLCWSQLQVDEKSMHLSTDIRTIPIEDIIHVKIRTVKQTKQSNTEDNSSSLRTHRLLVHYVKQGKGRTLRMGTCHFDGTSMECERLAEGINSKREGMPPTERKFLALINPVSGHCKSLQVYRTTVEPLLKACEISCDVVVSPRSGSMERTAETHSLQEYSGVLVVGGDGSLNEVVRGLVARSMREAGHDINDHNCHLVPVTIPVALIPTGSGNSLIHNLQDNHDVITAVIHVLRGHTVSLNVVTIHQPDRFLHLAFLVQHIGFVGDIIHKGELNRWMGPARYLLASQSMLLHRRTMSVELTCGRPGLHQPSAHHPGKDNRSMESTADSGSTSGSSSSKDTSTEESGHAVSSRDPPSGSPKPDTNMAPVLRPATPSDGQCPGLAARPDGGARQGCSGVGQESGRDDRNTVDIAADTDRIQADVYNIGIVITQCLTPEGRMETRLSADTMTLMVVKKCPLTPFIRHLTKLRDNLPGIDQFDFVDMREVVSLQLALTTPDTQKQHWYVNSDGETVSLTSALCYFRLHPRVFRVFGPRTVSRAC